MKKFIKIFAVTFLLACSSMFLFACENNNSGYKSGGMGRAEIAYAAGPTEPLTNIAVDGDGVLR